MDSGPEAADDDPLLLLEDYELLSTLGEGSCAKVKLGRHLQTGTEVAVKVIPRRGQERPVLQEARCMRGLRHPNVVQLYQVIETEEAVFLVMELMSRGDLGGLLQTYGLLAEGEARRLFRQLVSALHYCHGRGVIHRDVKPQNILLDRHRNARLSDFSLSSPFGTDKLSTLCGTPVYTAPEIFRGEDYAGPPVDVWSLGVVLYQMVTGTIPFKGEDLNELNRNVQRGVYKVPPFLSPELQHLLRTLLTLNPEERSSLREVMPDAWVNQGHAEELRPFAEPGGEDLDPAVEREMLALGFAREDIRSSLAHRAYGRTAATYRILAAERARTPPGTIPGRPRGAADPHGSAHSRHRDADTRRPPEGPEPGPEAEESAGPGAAAAGRSPPSRKASVQPRAKQTKASRGHSLQLPRPVRRPGRKLRSGPARPRTSRTPGMAALPADRGSCVDADSRPSPPPPALDADPRPSPPPPVLAWGSRPSPPPPALDADPRPSPPPPALDADSRPSPPPPALDAHSRPSPPPPALDADPRPSPPPPALDADPRPSPPPPAPEDFSSEAKRQGRRGLRIRFINFLRRLCCLPPKNNRVQPLLEEEDDGA